MLPFSLQNLRAFEAAGRNASFRAALRVFVAWLGGELGLPLVAL